VVRHVLHREVARARRRPAVGHALDLDEVGFAQVDQLRVLRRVLGVPTGDQGQAVYRALALLAEGRERPDETLLTTRRGTDWGGKDFLFGERKRKRRQSNALEGSSLSLDAPFACGRRLSRVSDGHRRAGSSGDVGVGTSRQSRAHRRSSRCLTKRRPFFVSGKKRRTRRERLGAWKRRFLADSLRLARLDAPSNLRRAVCRWPSAFPAWRRPRRRTAA
jgi:hypothetical protein